MGFYDKPSASPSDQAAFNKAAKSGEVMKGSSSVVNASKESNEKAGSDNWPYTPGK